MKDILPLFSGDDFDHLRQQRITSVAVSVAGSRFEPEWFLCELRHNLVERDVGARLRIGIRHTRLMKEQVPKLDLVPLRKVGQIFRQRIGQCELAVL